MQNGMSQLCHISKCHREISIITAFLVLSACLIHINFAFVTYVTDNNFVSDNDEFHNVTICEKRNHHFMQHKIYN